VAASCRVGAGAFDFERRFIVAVEARGRTLPVSPQAAIESTLSTETLMVSDCPRCRRPNRKGARFCAACGLSLAPGIDGSHSPGRIAHPRPAAPPAGFNPCADAAQLYYAWESSLGGSALIGTEGLVVSFFNAGYGLCDAVVALRGEGRDAVVVLERSYDIPHLPQGKAVTLEVPSYDLAGPLRVLRAALVAAQFDDEYDRAEEAQ